MRFGSMPAGPTNSERRTNVKKHIRYIVLLATILALFCSTQIAAQENSCASSPETQKLNYWLGDWSIAAPGSAADASSHVSFSLEKCVIVENWKGENNHFGENIFGYSTGDKSWKGFFADNRGHVHVFVDGRVSAGKAEFEGPSRGEKGEQVLNRIRITQLSADKVEQTWDKSTDNGATWAPQFRLEYTRKKS